MDKIIYLEDAKAAVRTIIYDYNGIYDNRSQYGVILDAMNRLDGIPPAQPEQRWIPITEESVIQAGYEGKEVRFRLRGRLFAIRELAQ